MKLAQRFASLRPCLPKMLADVVLFALAYMLAFTARLGFIEAPYGTTLLLTLPFVVIVKVAIFHFVGSYRSIWKYSSLQDLEGLLFGIILAGGAVMATAFLLPPSVPLPRAVPLIDMALTMVFAGGVRMLVRTFNESSTVLRKGHRLRMRLRGAYRSTYRMRRTLIVGAGDSGEMIVREMMRSPMMDYVPRRVRGRRHLQARTEHPRAPGSGRAIRHPAARGGADHQRHPHHDPHGPRGKPFARLSRSAVTPRRTSRPFPTSTDWSTAACSSPI